MSNEFRPPGTGPAPSVAPHLLKGSKHEPDYARTPLFPESSHSLYEYNILIPWEFHAMLFDHIYPLFFLIPPISTPYPQFHVFIFIFLSFFGSLWSLICADYRSWVWKPDSLPQKPSTVTAASLRGTFDFEFLLAFFYSLVTKKIPYTNCACQIYGYVWGVSKPLTLQHDH